MKVFPYVYKVVNRNTNEFYIGYREANRKPANEDIVTYKTSSVNVRPIFDQFDAYIIAEFITETGKDDAYWFEQQLISEHIDDPLCLNRYFIEPNGKNKKFKSKKGRKCKEDTRLAISKTKNTIDPVVGLTNAQFSSIKSVETRKANGTYYSGAIKANVTKLQRGSNKTGGQKSSITKNTIDPVTGLTNSQLAGKKGSITKNTIDPVTGLTNSQLAGKKGSITKNTVDPVTGLTNSQLAGQKLKQTLQTIDPVTGLTLKQKQILKCKETKKNNPKFGANASNAKHIQIFDDIGILRYDCYGTFMKTCKDENLSYTLFIKSAKTGTKISHTKSPHFGWYAILL